MEHHFEKMSSFTVESMHEQKWTNKEKKKKKKKREKEKEKEKEREDAPSQM